MDKNCVRSQPREDVRAVYTQQSPANDCSALTSAEPAVPRHAKHLLCSPLGFWRWSGPGSARLPAPWPLCTRTSSTASLSSTGYASPGSHSRHQGICLLQGWKYQLLHLGLKIFGKICQPFFFFLLKKENKLWQEKRFGYFFLRLLIGRFLPLQSAALKLCPCWKVTAFESCKFSSS